LPDRRVNAEAAGYQLEGEKPSDDNILRDGEIWTARDLRRIDLHLLQGTGVHLSHLPIPAADEDQQRTVPQAEQALVAAEEEEPDGLYFGAHLEHPG